jgi:uncharacterized glyoxalase superfamily protein PhnB
MIEWLCNTWNFEKHMVIEGENKLITYAELLAGEFMIMIASVQNPGKYNNLMIEPTVIEGKCTQAPYIVVDDLDWYYNQAKRNGATILIEIKDEEYGGRDFTCADPEGHIWNFGSFDPFTIEH